MSQTANSISARKHTELSHPFFISEGTLHLPHQLSTLLCSEPSPFNQTANAGAKRRAGNFKNNKIAKLRVRLSDLLDRLSAAG
jgi:hypothetical protein